MSGTGAGLRGRGRGRGALRTSSSRQVSPSSDTEKHDDPSEASLETGHQNDAEMNPVAGPSRPSVTPASRVTPAPGGSGATLLRKNVYTGASKMKFMPTMVKRKNVPEVQVKEEEAEPSLGSTSSRGRGTGRGRGRGRGTDNEPRGRGRGQNEVVMTASGAFAFGPAQQERIKRSIAAGGSGAGGGGGSGGRGGASGGYALDAGPSSTAALVDSDPEDYEDADEGGSSARKTRTVDLYDIGLESEMAPLVLPRDEKKWQEEEELRRQNEKNMGSLSLGGSDTKPVVKTDPYEDEDMAAASLAGTLSASATPGPAAGSTDLGTNAAQEDAAVLGAEDVQIKVKKEDISQYFDLPKEEASHERFYVFQFPRLFPQFADAEGSSSTTGVDAKPETSAIAEALDGEARHKIRSAYHESESEAWREYLPGRWQGWGRNPGREGREPLGIPDGSAALQAPEGRIGKVKVRRSGRTTLKLGKIEYEILPGAPSFFLQEVAILEDKDQSDGESRKGMYVMGQASKKFVITPELGKLLRQDAREKQERRRKQKEEEEAKARKLKEEEAAAAAELSSKAAASSAAKAKKPIAKAPLGRGRTSAAAGANSSKGTGTVKTKNTAGS